MKHTQGGAVPDGAPTHFPPLSFAAGTGVRVVDHQGVTTEASGHDRAESQRDLDSRDSASEPPPQKTMRRGPGHADLGLGRCPPPPRRPEARGTQGTSPLLEAEISSSLYSGVESNLGDRGFPGGSVIKSPPAKPETQVQFLGQEASLEKEMATYSSILLGKFHGQRSLVGYSSWGAKELETI